MRDARWSMVVCMSSEPTKSQPVTASIAPWLSVADATEAVDYYKTAFGAVEVDRRVGLQALAHRNGGRDQAAAAHTHVQRAGVLERDRRKDQFGRR